MARLIAVLPKSFIWQFSKKYIAGTTLSDALEVSKALNTSGYLT